MATKMDGDEGRVYMDPEFKEAMQGIGVLLGIIVLVFLGAVFITATSVFCYRLGDWMIGV
jgi:hypothetical protein